MQNNNLLLGLVLSITLHLLVVSAVIYNNSDVEYSELNNRAMIVEIINPHRAPAEPVRKISKSSVKRPVNIDSNINDISLDRVESLDDTIYEDPVYQAEYLHNLPPEYPPQSLRRREQGRVMLRVSITDSGNADIVSIDKSSGFDLLDQAAVTVVQQWRFIPAKRNHIPVTATVLIPIKFSLL